MTFVAIVAGGYLLGSCPWGYWLVRLFRGEDVRGQGSGATGASNVWRAYGPRLGVAVVLLDVLKGFVPALVGVLAVSNLCGILAGAAAMVGHARPLFLRFAKGGKMVATAGGVLFAVAPWAALAIAAVWLATFALTRYTSVASLVSAVALPVAAFALGYDLAVIVFTAVAAASVIVLHRSNLRRLRAGTENRVRLRGTAQQTSSPGRPGPPAGDPFVTLVALACHDLRTPLATVSGFAKTLLTADPPVGRETRFVELIDEAAGQMAQLLDQLELAARISSGRYEPVSAAVDTLALAAGSRDERIRAVGTGALIETDPEAAGRALAALATAALRFGELASLTWQVSGRELTLGPLPPAAAAVVDGSAPRDLGALVARIVIERLGGSVGVAEGTLDVRL